MFSWLADWLWGYDFFVSYSHRDGILVENGRPKSHYVRSLVQQLRDCEEKFSVFLDETEFDPGIELKAATKRHVRASTKLLLVARPNAIESKWVYAEVQEAIAAGTQIVVIDVNGTFENSPDDQLLRALIGDTVLRHLENLDALDGSPSRELLGKLIAASKRSIRQRRRLQAIAATSVVLAVLLVIAMIMQQIAASRSRTSNSQRIATASQSVLRTRPQLAVLLAEEAQRGLWAWDARPTEIEQSRINASQVCTGVGLTVRDTAVICVRISPNGRWLATGSDMHSRADDATIRLYDLQSENKHIPARVFRGSFEWVGALVFSPNSRWLISSVGFRTGFLRSNNHSAYVWDLQDLSSTAPHVELTGHADEVSVLAFSHDGTMVATGSGDKMIRIWTVDENGTFRHQRTLEWHTEELVVLRFSADGHRLASASRDGSIAVWNLKADEFRHPLAFIPKPEGAKRFTAVAISNDLSQAATAGAGTADVWNITADSVITKQRTFKIDKAPTFELEFSPDGRWLAAAPGFVSQFGGFESRTGSGIQDYRTARIWDLKSQEEAPWKVFPGGDGIIYDVAFSPDSRKFLEAGGNGIVRIWNLEDQDAAATPMQLPGHDGPIRVLDVSPDWVVSGSNDCSARLWRLSNPNEFAWYRVLRGFQDRIRRVAISPDEHWLASAGDASEVRVWNLKAKSIESSVRILSSHTKRITGLAFSQDGKLFSSSSDGTTCEWNLSETTNVDPVTLTGPAESVWTLAVSPNGKQIATGGTDGCLCYWDPQSSDPSKRLQVLFEKGPSVDLLAFSPNGKWLYCGRQGGVGILWEIDSEGRPTMRHQLQGHTGTVLDASFSKDEIWLATSSGDDTARIWPLHNSDPSKGCVVLKGHAENVNSVTFTDDDRWIVTGSVDGSIRLWRRQSGKPTADCVEWRGHSRSVTSIQISPDDDFLFSGSDDATVRIWDLNSRPIATARPLVLFGHQETITCLAVSQHWLASGSMDGTVRLASRSLDSLTESAKLAVGRNMTQDEWELYFPGIPTRNTFGEFSGQKQDKEVQK